MTLKAAAMVAAFGLGISKVICVKTYNMRF